jgi:hypothetical protein
MPCGLIVEEIKRDFFLSKMITTLWFLELLTFLSLVWPGFEGLLPVYMTA